MFQRNPGYTRTQIGYTHAVDGKRNTASVLPKEILRALFVSVSKICSKGILDTRERRSATHAR